MKFSNVLTVLFVLLQAAVAYTDEAVDDISKHNNASFTILFSNNCSGEYSSCG